MTSSPEIHHIVPTEFPTPSALVHLLTDNSRKTLHLDLEIFYVPVKVHVFQAIEGEIYFWEI